MSQPFVPGARWSLENQLGRYRVDRNAEQKNSNRQQLRVDEELARERGDFETVSNIARVAKGVASSLATEFENKFAKPSPQQAADIASKAVQLAGSRDLLGLIRLGLQTGQLSNIYKAITQLKPKNKKARLAISDIKNSAELKQALNDSTKEFAEGKATAEEVAAMHVQAITGGDDDVLSTINEALSVIESGAFQPKKKNPKVKDMRTFPVEALKEAVNRFEMRREDFNQNTPDIVKNVVDDMLNILERKSLEKKPTRNEIYAILKKITSARERLARAVESKKAGESVGSYSSLLDDVDSLRNSIAGSVDSFDQTENMTLDTGITGLTDVDEEEKSDMVSLQQAIGRAPELATGILNASTTKTGLKNPITGAEGRMVYIPLKDSGETLIFVNPRGEFSVVLNKGGNELWLYPWASTPNNLKKSTYQDVAQSPFGKFFDKKPMLDAKPLDPSYFTLTSDALPSSVEAQIRRSTGKEYIQVKLPKEINIPGPSHGIWKQNRYSRRESNDIEEFSNLVFDIFADSHFSDQIMPRGAYRSGFASLFDIET